MDVKKILGIKSAEEKERNKSVRTAHLARLEKLQAAYLDADQEYHEIWQLRKELKEAHRNADSILERMESAQRLELVSSALKAAEAKRRDARMEVDRQRDRLARLAA